MRALTSPHAALAGVGALAVVFTLLAGPGEAAGPVRIVQADPARVAQGRQLAEALCATCHLRGNDAEKSADSSIPGFRAVAKRPGQTEAHIVEWLLAVPQMMPNHRLTQDEATSLAAYILTLKDD